MTDPIVETSNGPIRGAQMDGVRVFKGIPYAADTSGENRFRPPQPRPPWSTVRDCLEFGPSCPQMTVEQMLGVPVDDETEAMLGTRNYERVMGEDCLVVNVWTPAEVAGAGLPVLVWLHGGGLSTGSASWPLYEFANLARRGNVVVSVNHRLGILGFLDVSRFGEDYADSGLAGMLDVVSALEWIKANVEGFGGDPGNVTVFGESGGGTKVAILLGMPCAEGLFHKAVAMSGSILLAQTPESAAVNTAAVLEYLGLSEDVGALTSVDVERLIDAEVELPGRAILARGRGFGPVIGPSLPRHPVDAIRDGLNRDVTLVSGCNSDEMLAFMGAEADLWDLDMAQATERIERYVGDATTDVIACYQAARPDDSPTSHLISITTDARFRIPQIRLAEAHAEGGASATYMYVFVWGFEDPTGQMRSPHGIDMPFFFDTVEHAPATGFFPDNEALYEMMSGVLPALAGGGAPGHPALPEWPVYTLGGRETMVIGVPPRVVTDPLGNLRDCWEGVRLGGVAPGDQ